MKWTESDIQALKAQEAKDLAVEFLLQIEAKDRGPVSPGEVQLKELDYELRLREAELQDQREREVHERRIKELELDIQQERSRAAEAESRANEVRQSFARIIERVGESSELLSTRLERASREQKLKVEQMTADFTEKQANLARQIQDLEQARESLRDEIADLTGVRGDAEQVARLREEIDRRKKDVVRISAEAEELVSAAEFERDKRLGDTRRQQELELVRLETEHQKAVLQRSRHAADKLCEALGLVVVDQPTWNQVNQRVAQEQQRCESDREQIRAEAREAIRREFNITRNEPVDVTDLFYREQAARSAVDALRQSSEKQDVEIRRMRQHIEQEPQRIAAAIEAAKTQVQNFIEQGVKR